MQPQDEFSECPKKGASDRGWDSERSALENALRLAIALLTHTTNRSVHIADDGTVNLSANLKGSGGTNA